MPYRKSPLVSQEIYHLCNRSVAELPIFVTGENYHRALELIDFYRFPKTGIRFSYFKRLSTKQKSDLMTSLYSTKPLVEIYAFCLMPNHVHFLVKQKIDGGAARFMRIFQNSFAKYLNTKNDRSGAVFQSMFKAIRIVSEEQLTHVFRYINLNPVTSFIVKNVDDLENYPWTSYQDYIKTKPVSPFINTDLFKSIFKTPQKLKEFLVNQVNYQRTLNQIKHLTLE